jgi:hypothetical protein
VATGKRLYDFKNPLSAATIEGEEHSFFTELLCSESEGGKEEIFFDFILRFARIRNFNELSTS